MINQRLYDLTYKTYFASYGKWKRTNNSCWNFLFRCSVAFGQRFFSKGYLSAIQKRPVYGLNTDGSRKEKIVVSLTTFPARIDKVWITIETVMRQTVKPDAIELWLSREQFPGEEKDLPEKLLAQTKRGLSICFCDGDLRSHKKYYYAMQQHPNDIIITVDDDLFYPSDTIEILMQEHRKNPLNTVGVSNTLIEKENFMKPIDWKMHQSVCRSGINVGIVGGSGSLYPPGVLDKRAFDQQKIRELSFLADDQWLTVMTYMNHRKITTVGRLPFLISVPDTQAQALTYSNNSSASEINNNTQWEKTISCYEKELSDWISQFR